MDVFQQEPWVLCTQPWSTRVIHLPQESCFHPWSVHPFMGAPALQTEIRTAFHRGKGMGATTPIKCWHHHSRHSLEHKGITTKSALYRTGNKCLLLLWAVPEHKSCSFFPSLVVQLKNFLQPCLFSLGVSDFHYLKMGICGTKRNSSIFLGKRPENNQSGAALSRGFCVSSVRTANYLGT